MIPRYNANILGILPARSGSKGIPDKNLREVAGRPLLSWAAEALLRSSFVRYSICSTDSADIAQLAEQSGLEVPFLRSPALATDTSNVLDSIKDALARLGDPERFTHVVLVQATSPTVTAADVDEAASLCVSRGFDCVVSAVRVPHSQNPALTFTSGDDGLAVWVAGPEQATLRRQDFPLVFRRTGLVYVFRTQHLLSEAGLYSGKTGFIEIDEDRAISIDDQDDLMMAERFLQRLHGDG